MCDDFHILNDFEKKAIRTQLFIFNIEFIEHSKHTVISATPKEQANSEKTSSYVINSFGNSSKAYPEEICFEILKHNKWINSFFENKSFITT